MRKIIAMLLCLVLLAGLFTGCAAADDPQAYIPTGDALEREEEDTQEEWETEEEENEQSMSLAYYPDRSMNPLETADFTNRALMTLLYQGLFAVNREYEAIPILCKSYETSADMKTYVFHLDPKATFSDGTPVTVEDAVASLQRAEDTDYYTGRLHFVRNISATEDGALQIDLFHPLENLPLLLDIPIVKAEQVELPNPLGTGPYVLRGIGVNTYLSRRDDWWCKSKDLTLTAKKISLLQAESTTSIRDAFEFDDVGIVCTDPGSDRYVEYRCDYELWDCETGMFLYLGVNEDSDAFQSAEVRRALSKSINRDLLVDQYYQGFAASAALPVSPDSPYYVATLAQKYEYDPISAASAMSAVKGQTVRLLVNQNDSFRVKVAQEIGRMLSANGLIVEVVSASSDGYRYAIRNGNYDLYLGQTRLSPNMDLSAFFSESGALNYGGIDNPGIYNLCLQALENQGNFYTLYQAIMDEAYLCPVLFRSYAVYAVRGLVTDLQPARDNLFCYSIGKTITEAYTGLLDSE